MSSQPLLPKHATAGRPGSRYGTVASGPSGHIITSFLIGNLHCPSCVSTIRETLEDACGSDLIWVSPNIVTSVVTVEHRDAGKAAAVTIKAMSKALDLAGFEVCSATSSAMSSARDTQNGGTSGPRRAMSDRGDHTAEGPSDGALRRIFRASIISRLSMVEPLQRQAAHLANCEDCRSSRAHSPHQPSEPGHRAGHEPQKSVFASGTSTPFEGVTVAGSSASVKASQQYTRATISVGGMTCTSCVRSIEEELSKWPDISRVVVNLVNNSAVVDFTGELKAGDVVAAIEDLGYDAVLDEVINLDREPGTSEKHPQMWTASLAIGGMTCASCSNAITSELKKKEWVSDVSVNLVSNSASVKFTVEGKEKDIVEAIEDMGYEATVDSVESHELTADEAQERTVHIKVDGLFCKHCPGRLIHSVAAFGSKLEIISEPTTANPIITIKYVPDAPTFTIRRILDAIEAADPAFEASIHHPPTLEERSKAVTARHQQELLRRVYLSLIIAIPTFIIGIVYMNLVPDSDHGKHYLMKPWFSGINRAQIILFVLATPVYFFATDVFHVRAYKELRNLWRKGSRTPILRRFYKFGSMNLLISLGTTVAFLSSIAQLIAAAIEKPDVVQDTQFYFDSVVFLTLFLLLGRLIEAYSKAKTGDAVEMLGKLRPSTAILVEDGGNNPRKVDDRVVGVDMIEFGDLVRVQHGASPVADGVIIRGQTSFDESSLTGESRLIKKVVGDGLFAGTVNKGSSVLMRITGAPGRSMLDQIVQVVREGQTKRAPMERIADMLTAYFVPIITLIAVLTWLVWTILGMSGALPGHYLDTTGGWVAFALQFAIAVFVVACPCGLGLAAPTAIFVGGGIAAKHGILAKGGGEAFEKASKIDVVVFDKTGTLTMGGEPKITDSVAFPDEDTPADDARIMTLISALRAVEENSGHPIAKAIVAYCTSVTDKRAEVESVEELPGKGMKAVFPGDPSAASFHMLAGNEALMRDYNVPLSPAVQGMLSDWKSQAKSVALVATRSIADASSRWSIAAALSISDPIRPEAVAIVRALRARGTGVWMLSGDNAVTARAVATQLGIEHENVMAEVLPSQKAEKVTYLQSVLKSRATRYLSSGDEAADDVSRRATVAMVGDGINDSPALTRADVGIAVGSGSDVAISSADFVLVSNDLRSVVTLLTLSSAVFRRIRLNFAWAVVYNVLALPVAAGCLYPVMTPGGQHVRLDPVWAALAMALSSISVVLSSLALRIKVPGIGYRAETIEVE
ncbi:copper-transporting ATPase [Plectosphaerella cucumerina]|uniref:Copper-transporting ATPase n=1 Tax=Plectosphaerella cucumerina TaxID=40658 RepID=A0A8K0T3U9_9PEZI|nr:copper-transporting ATPase [Plectosphaerella cucumerina]